MLPRLSGARSIWGSHFEKCGRETVSWSGLSFLPVNEQELGQIAQWDIQRRSYSSLSLWCFVECSQALFKWQKLEKELSAWLTITHFLLMQKCRHARWPHVKHRERRVSGSWHLGKHFSKDGLGSPWASLTPGIWEVKTIFIKALRHYLTCSLSFSLKCSVFQKTHDMGYSIRWDAWADKRIQPSPTKPDTTEICSKVKQWHYSQ